MNSYTHGAVGTGELQKGDGGRAIRHMCLTKPSLYSVLHGVISMASWGVFTSVSEGVKDG